MWMKKSIHFVSILLFFFVFSASTIHAQENKSYYYKSFDENISVEKDSSFVVEERQLYSYKGDFNKGYRNILLKDISDITDIVVIDGQTGLPLSYSPAILDKLSSSSWGKYTYYKKNGEMIIEWYYNISNSDHLWILKYKVHGGIGYFKDHDEVYWNVFTDYDVPIASSTVTVSIPQNAFKPSDLLVTAYTTGVKNNPQKWFNDDGTFSHFSADSFGPKESFTVALGWPKGLLHQSDFWKWWILFYFGYIFFVFVILCTIILLFIYWLYSEKLKKGRGTIIAEYTPPRDLPPAMAELVITEGISSRAWPATIVDLAVRGYIKITEEKGTLLMRVLGFVAYLPIVIVSIFILDSLGSNTSIVDTLVVIIVTSPFTFVMYKALKSISSVNDYTLSKLNDFESDQKLHDYEKYFLNALFSDEAVFSTKAMRSKSNTAKMRLSSMMLKLKEKVRKEVSEEQADAYDVSIINDSSFSLGISASLVAAIIIFALISGLFDQNAFLSQCLMVILAVLWSISTLYVFKKYNPRLSEKGRILREEWLGFKLYLETAEKYRMQNLTPEIFEKYLPYAIIFGVEKKWAKSFELVIKQEPVWFVGSTHGFIGPTTSMSNFSASAFSTSFSSSLSTAFMSSVGGGLSGGAGGGGFGGGGGGGGGGGAS